MATVEAPPAAFEVIAAPEQPQGSLTVQALVRVNGARFLGIFRPYRNGNGLEVREEDLITLLDLNEEASQ
ncbi:MAG: hypothetical protein PHW10_02060 [Candidatus Peribacteraceae bacterium]|nr:hypothetical protein [Candidatus Peribacteraceae bacterium]